MSCRAIRRVAFPFVLCLALLSLALSPAQAQAGNTDELKGKAATLVQQNRYLDAVPVFERLIQAEPNNPDHHFNLAFGYVAQAIVTTNSAPQRAALRVRARNEFIKAKELGEKAPVVDAMIEGLPADGADAQPFSTNHQANDLMNGAEALFSQGKLDSALVGYEKALELDPKLYHAALFAGDVYMHRGDFDQAEAWYQKAIVIDPGKEVAYRYSATPFMKQGKYDLARDRYVEAYIREPYNKFAVAGITQWGQVTKTKLGNPAIDVPTDVTFNKKGDVDLKIDPSTLGKDDGSAAWIIYGGVRSIWHKEKFAQRFPKEAEYRHSLFEEVDALRSVLSVAAEDNKVKTFSPSLAKLKELNDKGLLESYILLARADEGISVDYPDYLAHNHDKLRQYVIEYVLANGGK